MAMGTLVGEASTLLQDVEVAAPINAGTRTKVLGIGIDDSLNLKATIMVLNDVLVIKVIKVVTPPFRINPM